MVKNPPAKLETWVGKILWRREKLPTPIFWPGEFHGLHSPWDRKELDMTEQLSFTRFIKQIFDYKMSLCHLFFPLPPFLSEGKKKKIVDCRGRGNRLCI